MMKHTTKEPTMKPIFNLKKVIAISIITLALLQILPLIVYFNHFKESSLSNNSSDWGAFADFYSGTLNPLLSAINILILIIITFKVQKWDEERNEKSLHHQSNIFKNELKYNAYKEFLRVFESIIAELANFDEELPLRIMLKRFSLISLKSQNSHLFKTLGNEEKLVVEIADDISKLSVFLQKEMKKMTSLDDYDNIKDSIDSQFFLLIRKYETLLGSLQEELNIEFD